MTRASKLLAALAASILFAIVAIAADPPRLGVDLTGTWLLVEQTYGSGGSNLVAPGEPIRLRIDRTAKGPAVRIWQGSDEAAGSAWPAIVADGRELRALSRSATIDPDAPTLRGRCRLVPVEGERLELDVRETYTLSKDGKSLQGIVEVRFLEGDREHGGYTLHRRFERER